MKLRSILIVLLAVFLVFALASCKNEPKEPENKPQPIPTDNTIYKLTATVARNSSWYGADKFRINLENGGVVVKEGSTLYFKFRATTEFYEFNLRSSIEDSLKWVYEQDKSKFESFSEPDEDGWITVTYTFGDLYNGNDASELYGEKTGFFLDFIGDIIVGDVLEIKNVVVDGKLIPITPDMIVDKYVKPTFEANAAANWAADGKYVVYYFLGDPDPKDSPYRTPTAEIVNAGQTITTNLEQEGKNLVIYNLGPESGFRHFDYDNPPAEAIFEKTTPITYNTKLLLVYTPISYDVTFALDGATSDPIDTQSIKHGELATKPADPEKTGQTFGGWYADANKTTPFDFTAPIKEVTTIYAAWGDPVAVTFYAENGETEHTVVNAAKNYPVKQIADPKNGSKIFDGWYLKDASEAFDFSTPITDSTDLYAHWINATEVTLMEGSKTLKTFQTALDEALSENDKNLVLENRIASFFEGWFTDPELKNAYDFSKNVTGPLELYAKWRPGKIAKITSTYDNTDSNTDKFRIKFTDGDYKTELLEENAVLSFRYRSTVPFNKFSVRCSSFDYTYEKAFKTTAMSDTNPYDIKVTSANPDDGWTYVEYTFPADGTKDRKDRTITYGEGVTFYFDFLNQGATPAIAVGDIVEVQGMALNGKELTIDSGNVQSGLSSTKPNCVVIESVDEWANHSVTFHMGVADAIDPKSVEYGARIEKPADPKVDGYKFIGWYGDANFDTEFNFASPIVEDVNIYAKFEEKSTPSYKVSFNLNYTGAAAAKEVEVDEGAKLPDVGIGRPGYTLDGWFTEAEGGSEIDLTNHTVSAAETLYAHWTKETSYVRVSFDDPEGAVYKRFDLQFADSVFSPKAGDVIAFKYRSKDNKVVSGCLRNSEGSGKVIYWSGLSGFSLNTDDDENWETFYYEYGSNDYAEITYPMSGIRFELAQSSNESNFATGDWLEILGFTINGKAPAGGITSANFPTAVGTGKATVTPVTPTI